jgi:hypothetical protein
MFDFSTQATTYLILIVITSIINLICYSLLFGIWGFVFYLVYVLITVPLVILWMYNIDCLTTGDCQIWSWVITSLTLISVLITTIMLVAFAVNPTLASGVPINTTPTTITVSDTTPAKVATAVATSATPAVSTTAATPAATTTAAAA